MFRKEASSDPLIKHGNTKSKIVTILSNKRSVYDYLITLKDSFLPDSVTSRVRKLMQGWLGGIGILMYRT